MPVQDDRCREDRGALRRANDHSEITDGFARRITSGTFALQAHDPESKVQYRNLRVRRLD